MNPSSIRPARTEDLAEMCRLLSNGSRSYTNVAFEELPALLQGGSGAAVQVDSQKISGFVVLQQEDLADEQVGHAPAKVSLRAAATMLPGVRARKQFSVLFECAGETLPPRPAGQLVYALTDQNWLQAGLRVAGFVHHDSIRFYERRGPVAPSLHRPARLFSAVRSDLSHIARVDAATFEPLWRMDVAELTHLHRECRVEVAVRDGKKVGYAALNLCEDGERRDEKAAQLVRLAVHPRAQGLGIGRQLLVSSLCHARTQGIDRVFLNTQESNRLSQRLYESVQFRKRGRAVPVYVKGFPFTGTGAVFHAGAWRDLAPGLTSSLTG